MGKQTSQDGRDKTDNRGGVGGDEVEVESQIWKLKKFDAFYSG